MLISSELSHSKSRLTEAVQPQHEGKIIFYSNHGKWT